MSKTRKAVGRRRRKGLYTGYLDYGGKKGLPA